MLSVSAACLATWRERLFRGGRPPPDVRGRTVILVDDGLATGSTMLAAVKALRAQQPGRIVVVAVPTASAETCKERGPKHTAVRDGFRPVPDIRCQFFLPPSCNACNAFSTPSEPETWLGG